MNATPMIDGKQALLEFVRQFHPRHEHTPTELEKLLRRIGFAVRDTNDDRLVLAGPLETTTACRTLRLYGGPVVIRHLELVQALERLTETGVPTWTDELAQFEWHCRQLEQCAPFQVPAAEDFANRAELEAHIEACPVCQPADRLLSEAINAGSRRFADKDLRELIERSHKDQTDAVRFYSQIRDSHRAPFVTEKPQRAKREQVPA